MTIRIPLTSFPNHFSLLFKKLLCVFFKRSHNYLPLYWIYNFLLLEKPLFFFPHPDDLWNKTGSSCFKTVLSILDSLYTRVCLPRSGGEYPLIPLHWNFFWISSCWWQIFACWGWIEFFGTTKSLFSEHPWWLSLEIKLDQARPYDLGSKSNKASL